MIHELCISGGGIRGLAYLSAVYELQKRKMLTKLKKVSATSIGVFIAICLILGQDLSELIQMLFEYDFKDLKDINIRGIFGESHSIMKGEKIYDLFEKSMSTNKYYKNDLTLYDLYEISGGIELIAVSFCVSTLKLVYINYKSHPHLYLTDLIRMCTAIPLILPPFRLSNKLYVDGGVINNTPCNVLSKDCWVIRGTPSDTVTTGVENEEDSNLRSSEYFINIIKMFYIKYSSPKGTAKPDSPKGSHVIYVDTGDISVTSFNLNPDQKFSLVLSGKHAVINKLKKMF